MMLSGGAKTRDLKGHENHQFISMSWRLRNWHWEEIKFAPLQLLARAVFSRVVPRKPRSGLFNPPF
jgi:activator of HSP90 ATPase